MQATSEFAILSLTSNGPVGVFSSLSLSGTLWSNRYNMWSTQIPDERLSKHQVDAVTQFVEFQDIVNKSTGIDSLQVCHYANAIYIKKDN